MFFISLGASPKVEPPFPLNRDRIAAELRERYPDELRSRGVGGAVLVLVDIDHRGAVSNVRAGPLLGILPRLKPRRWSPGTGGIVRRLNWTREPALRQAAAQAMETARFVPGATDGVPTLTRGYRVACYFAPEVLLGHDSSDMDTCVMIPV
jgi:hypothetical protein